MKRPTAYTVQILGIASMIIGIGTAWQEFQSLSNSPAGTFGFGADFLSTLLAQPFFLIGVALWIGSFFFHSSAIDKESDAVDSQTIDCPFCKEPIRKAATKCKHCGSNLDRSE